MLLIFSKKHFFFTELENGTLEKPPYHIKLLIQLYPKQLHHLNILPRFLKS